jgi:cytoskeletal protein CcmA (bactofilin family)
VVPLGALRRLEQLEPGDVARTNGVKRRTPIRNLTPFSVQAFRAYRTDRSSLYSREREQFMGMLFASRIWVEGVSMSVMSLIGRSVSIKGAVMSQEPLTIAGHVDGSVEATGCVLTIAEGGRAKATLVADTILVSGAVEGSLSANAKIVVSETAVIEGELTAPSIQVADGAKIQGRIDTGNRKPSKVQLAS